MIFSHMYTQRVKKLFFFDTWLINVFWWSFNWTFWVGSVDDEWKVFLQLKSKGVNRSSCYFILINGLSSTLLCVALSSDNWHITQFFCVQNKSAPRLYSQYFFYFSGKVERKLEITNRDSIRLTIFTFIKLWTCSTEKIKSYKLIFGGNFIELIN